MKEREGKEKRWRFRLQYAFGSNSSLILVNPTLEERGGKEVEISGSLRSVSNCSIVLVNPTLEEREGKEVEISAS
jgi:hypothetical protein